MSIITIVGAGMMGSAMSVPARENGPALDEDELLALAAHTEYFSTHPIFV